MPLNLKAPMPQTSMGTCLVGKGLPRAELGVHTPRLPSAQHRIVCRDGPAACTDNSATVSRDTELYKQASAAGASCSKALCPVTDLQLVDDKVHSRLHMSDVVEHGLCQDAKGRAGLQLGQ